MHTYCTVHTCLQREKKWPKGCKSELLTGRLLGQSLNRQDKLDWGSETTTAVPLSKALNPHLLQRVRSVDKTCCIGQRPGLNVCVIYDCGEVFFPGAQ